MTPTLAFFLLSAVLLATLAKRWVAAKPDREMEQLRTYLGWKPAEASDRF